MSMPFCVDICLCNTRINLLTVYIELSAEVCVHIYSLNCLLMLSAVCYLISQGMEVSCGVDVVVACSIVKCLLTHYFMINNHRMPQSLHYSG